MEKNVVELFAGVGGFHVGLAKASDFNIIWANQWEPGRKAQHAFDCYYRHFHDTTVCINQDIATVKEEVPPHTLLVGGFPCQDYSVAATGAKGIEGKKGVLWWEINDILSYRHPPFVLLENVDRLLKSPSTQRGRDFGIMLASFHSLNYSVEWRVINAAEYGFAQRRRRIIIFAYRNDTLFSQRLSKIKEDKNIITESLFAKAFPIHGELESSEMSFTSDNLVSVSEHFSFAFENAGVMRNGKITTAHVSPVLEPPKLLADIIQRDVPQNFYLMDNLLKWEYLKGSKKINRISKTGHTYMFSEGGISFPDPLDRPARTMLTSESSLNRSSHVIKDPQTEQLRLLTPVECERINGFDDNWTDTGMPQRFRYFCMGNALVVGIIERLGAEIAKIIEKE